MLKINGIILISLLVLTGCGGGGGGTRVTVANGVFKDSNVSGLTAVSGGQKSITNALGAFKYEEGNDVSFNIGTVSLGSGKGKSIMTPIDLVTDGKLATPEVINKVRFLMMLDKDNMPSNGIEISSKVQAEAKNWPDVNFASDSFPTENVQDIRTSASVADDAVHKMPDATEATSHLKTTLLCANAGAYIGTYAGTESGKIVLAVNPVTGDVVGSSYDPDNEVSVDVKSTTALDYDIGLEFVSGEDSGKVYSGNISSSDVMSGTWVDSTDATKKGTFSSERLGGSSNAVYRYTVSYDGNDKGLFTFDVDKGNNIKGTTYSVTTEKESAITGKLIGNKLTATAADGSKIDGDLDEDTLTLNGVWSNVSALEAGTYNGGGCQLN